MLSISNLFVSVSNNCVINNCSANFFAQSTHVIMGLNGSGKSSLAATLMGHPDYHVTSGSIFVDGVDIINLSTYQRAQLGLFLAVQHPIEIQGLLVLSFLKELISFKLGKSITVQETFDIVKPLLQIVGLPESVLQRSVNVGFSGGEKKRFELLQMLLLKPRFAILDELDSGVDIDGLKHIARGLQWYREHNPNCSLIIITHYQHILEYLTPNYVHIMTDGAIVATGNYTLIQDVQKNGYAQYAKRS